jgi:alpha-1,3-mannosyltransferase
MLRLFNDCFAVLGLFSAIYAYQRNQWHLGTFLFTTGLNVKMTLLLPIPAMGFLFLQALGFREAVTQAMIIFQVSVSFSRDDSSIDADIQQLGYGFPFRKRAPSYFSRAFELTREFLYKWTVNWRFVSESTFLSRPFALGLLALHITLLLQFARSRWIKPSQRNPRRFLAEMFRGDGPRDQDAITLRVSPSFIMTTILTAVAIGVLCARSLHYQFYVYIAWTTPFLLWKAGFHPVVQYALWAAQEWAWNVYPSTPLSSGVVVGVLATTVGGVWWGTRNEFARRGVAANDFDSVQTNGAPVEAHAHAE